jgi:signal transduction histidine kinase
MVQSLRSLAPSSWLRLPGRTARLRLTLVYAGMFLLLGTAAIAITYLLTSSTSTIRVSTAVPAPLPLTARSQQAVPIPSAAPGAAPPVKFRRAALSRARGEVVRQHSADLSRLLAVSWLVVAVTALASAVLGWFASGRVLRPLREMTATARTISAGNLSQRLALTGPDDEFKQLGDTLDDLLARLEASFEAQRRFVANASHELRTPLTLERTLLQVALTDPNASAATLRATCEELLAFGRDHERLLEALLTLASSERGLDRREPLDLAMLAGQLLCTHGSEIERRSLRLGTALVPAPIMGDPALIERLIANLIDNAVRYNDAGGRVEIRTATDAGRSLLSISNTGPVLPADELERLFEPFQRLDGRRTAAADGHHGLGLSIVGAIASAHGATVTAQPQPSGGLAVTVSFAGSPTVGSGSVAEQSG